MFRLVPYYASASLAAVLATAALLMIFDRQVEIDGIVQQAERSNTDLAHVAMNPMKPALLDFLDTAANVRPDSASPPLPPELARSIASVMEEGPFVVRIRIYNPRGVVVFSTNPAEVGDDRSQNKGFIAALRGGVGNELVFRDRFNIIDIVTEDENLVQTYLPVRAGPHEPVRGVFELFGDLNSTHQAERSEFALMAGAMLILIGLYGVQVFIVRRAHKMIELQHRTIHERHENLALLADRMLKTEESHKQKIAFELHEGVAQTLAALKMKVESGQHDRKAGGAAGRSANPMVPLLQEVIEDVRAIAADLRPASLDDLGLLPTIHSLCREFVERHPGLRIEPRISIEERDLPPEFKGLLYRIIRSVLGDIAEHMKAARVQLDLELDDDALVLLIDESGVTTIDGKHSLEKNGEPPSRAGHMEELTTLSGGVFTATSRSDDGATLRSVWKR